MLFGATSSMKKMAKSARRSRPGSPVWFTHSAKEEQRYRPPRRAAGSTPRPGKNSANEVVTKGSTDPAKFRPAQLGCRVAGEETQHHPPGDRGRAQPSLARRWLAEMQNTQRNQAQVRTKHVPLRSMSLALPAPGGGRCQTSARDCQPAPRCSPSRWASEGRPGTGCNCTMCRVQPGAALPQARTWRPATGTEFFQPGLRALAGSECPCVSHLARRAAGQSRSRPAAWGSLGTARGHASLEPVRVALGVRREIRPPSAASLPRRRA